MEKETKVRIVIIMALLILFGGFYIIYHQTSKICFDRYGPVYFPEGTNVIIHLNNTETVYEGVSCIFYRGGKEILCRDPR